MNNKLRVGMVVHAYYLRDARVIRYAEALANEGHEVSVVCLQAPEDTPSEQVNGVDIYRVRFERKRGGKLWYIWEYIWSFVLFSIRLSQLELKQHFDVIHVHNMPDFLIFSGFIPRLRGAKLILDLHDPMPELFMSKYDLERGFIIRVLEFQERISCWYADALITVDQSFKDIFIRRGIRGDKINLVRNMPDNRFYLGERELPSSEHFTLLFAGTIAERYQLHDVIKAVKIARQQAPHVFFRIVGKLDKEGEYPDQLQNLVHELQLQNAVEFHPPVPLNDMPNLLRQAHLGVEPSRHDPYTDYVLPLKLLECVAAGVPCLVSRRPTIENYFSDEDLAYFEPGDIEGIAARIVELAQSPEKLKTLADNAQRVFERYNWIKEKASYFDTINRLTGK
ncbi:MAG: glycosyltransferase family 4 protein [Anaerolineae bacterium]|nr:glycosyltransferase family 4 protein [Anaerolineae bacterium]